MLLTEAFGQGRCSNEYSVFVISVIFHALLDLPD